MNHHPMNQTRMYGAGHLIYRLKKHPDLQHPDDQRDLDSALHAVDVLYRLGDLFQPDPYVGPNDIDRRFRDQVEGKEQP